MGAEVAIEFESHGTTTKKNGVHTVLGLVDGAVGMDGSGGFRTGGTPIVLGNGSDKANGSGEVRLGKPDLLNGGIASKISRLVLQDRELVNRCLARETGAWSQMYARFHAPLIASVRAFLGQAARDYHLVEEIAARVWYAVVRDDFWLLGRFDVERGCRLSTFLSLIAKAQARLLLRSERRRRTREHAVARYEIELPGDNGLYSLSGEEFIATLSPAERRFLVDVLVASADRDARDRYSSQNLWQLRRRVREKLLKFLD
jgi:DNA-directed RNA polymerase specialized sigma24 family protein